jgi:hypothetical protein
MGNNLQERSLHVLLSFVIENFPKVKEGNKIKGSSKPESLVQLNDQVYSSMKEFYNKLHSKLNDRAGENLEIWSNFGRGQGNWPEVTWIALGWDGSYSWDGNEIALPINVQFDDKVGGIFVTLLGYGKQLNDIYGDFWEGQVEKIRTIVQQKASELSIPGFKFDRPDAAHLRKGSDAYTMRLSYFMYKFYTLNNIPPDEEIVKDISALLDVQSNLYEMGSGETFYWAILPSEGEGTKGKELEYWPEWYQNGYVGIKWKDLAEKYGESLFSMDDLEYVKAYDDIYKDGSMRDMVWKFIDEMAKGDIILINRGKTSVIAQGNVLSEPYIEKGAECPIRRKVKWEQLMPERSIPDDLKGKFSRRVIQLSKDDYERIVGYTKQTSVDPTFQLIMKKKQVILFGPPGTGKTYRTKDLAISIIRGY